MTERTTSWDLKVDRGPNWLFVKLRQPPRNIAGSEVPLADELWNLLQQHFTSRLVLELDEVDRLQSWMMGQLVSLNKRVSTQGGMLRLCGLNKANSEALKASRLDHCLPVFEDRHEAVGVRPRQPR